MARRNWLVAGILILAAWGVVSFSFQGCSSNNSASAPVTVTQGVTLIATPPPGTVAGRDWNYKTLSAGFTARYEASGLVYGGQMWVIGGYGNGAFDNDVWSSADGTNWTQLLAYNASPGPNQFSGRCLQASVTFNNQMWVIGGDSGGSYLNDVWSSTDGATWTQVLANNASPGPNQFSIRGGLSCVVYNNKLWVIGGALGSTRYNDVWSSSDGVSWTNVLADNASPGVNQFTQRQMHTSLVYGGKLWVIGGYFGGPSLNDVWSSSNGVSWTNVLTDNASPGGNQFTRRYAHTSLVYGNAMWVIAGYSAPSVNDAWYSADGHAWYEATASAAFPPCNSHVSLAFNNAMWVISGATNGSLGNNDVWYSPF